MNVALRGAAASGDASTPPGSKPVPSRTNSMGSSTLSPSSHLASFTKATKSSSSANDEGLSIEVALKVIPKKKVKGNESSVWGEMEVLRGLDHPNIVSVVIFGRDVRNQIRHPSPSFWSRLCLCCMSGVHTGQILRVV